MLNTIFDFVLFTTGDFDFNVGQLLGLVLIFTLAGLAWSLTKAKWRIDFYQRNDIEPKNRRRFEKYIRQIIILISIFFIVRLLNLDFALFNSGGASDPGEDAVIFRYSIILIGLIVLVLAWLTEWYFSNVLINKYEKDRREEILNSNENPERVRAEITKLIQYIVVVLATLAVIGRLGWDISIDLPGKSGPTITPSKILQVVLIFLLARIIGWVLTQVALFSVFKSKNIDQGTRFAINQLLKYVIYFTASIIAIHTLGINMTLVLGGAAALLVGIGLGLQQTFNDFFSGLVLLFERSVSVGDIMDVDGVIGEVKRIGLRSSIIETRANISIIVPNSKLVNESVKNWSHFADHGRFDLVVGVAYGSNTALVKKLLLTAVKGHHQILDYPVPFVRFVDFGDSALTFSVYFFSNRYLIVEDVKSDIRFKIDELFRANNISIPFPQRDIWLRKEMKESLPPEDESNA